MILFLEIHVPLYNYNLATLREENINVDMKPNERDFS